MNNLVVEQNGLTTIQVSWIRPEHEPLNGYSVSVEPSGGVHQVQGLMVVVPLSENRNYTIGVTPNSRHYRGVKVSKIFDFLGKQYALKEYCVYAMSSFVNWDRVSLISKLH